MQKNVAGQKIGVQMVSASDGTAFTGSVTVYVTGDAGSQAIGSVGSGACTHEGNGYHSYAPAQSETNYDLIAFTFIGSGAVPVTVQVYTAINPVTAVPTAEANATAVRSDLGLTGSLDSAFGDIPTVSEFNARTILAADYATAGQATAIETDTQNIQTRLPAALVSGRIDASVGAYQSGLAPPTATENKNAVWNAATADHTSTGSFGYVIGLLFGLIENVTGWRFTSKALEQAPTGDITVNITPAYVTQQAVVDNNKITVRRGSRGWVLLTVTDPTTGDPIDLSVYTGLKFLVGPAGEATIQTQSVTAFGADNNQFYWKPNEASTSKERQLNWSLFNDIADTASQYYRAKPADGVVNVLESPV